MREWFGLVVMLTLWRRWNKENGRRRVGEERRKRAAWLEDDGGGRKEKWKEENERKTNEKINNPMRKKMKKRHVSITQRSYVCFLIGFSSLLISNQY